MGEATVVTSAWRLVEVGRVVLFSQGPYTGKLAAIVEIIDHKRVLVDGPASSADKAVPRHSTPLAHVSLTGIVIPKLPRSIGTASLKGKWGKAEVETQYDNSSFAKSKARSARRKQLTDFEKFKVMRLKKQARFEVRKALAKAKASS